MGHLLLGQQPVVFFGAQKKTNQHAQPGFLPGAKKSQRTHRACSEPASRRRHSARPHVLRDHGAVQLEQHASCRKHVQRFGACNNRPIQQMWPAFVSLHAMKPYPFLAPQLQPQSMSDHARLLETLELSRCTHSSQIQQGLRKLTCTRTVHKMQTVVITKTPLCKNARPRLLPLNM